MRRTSPARGDEPALDSESPAQGDEPALESESPAQGDEPALESESGSESASHVRRPVLFADCQPLLRVECRAPARPEAAFWDRAAPAPDGAAYGQNYALY